MPTNLQKPFFTTQICFSIFEMASSRNQNKTIEAFAIERKVDRVKQLLREGELTLSEISYRLGYSNVQHLSKQFRAITGSSVSEFKNGYARSVTIPATFDPPFHS